MIPLKGGASPARLSIRAPIALIALLALAAAGAAAVFGFALPRSGGAGAAYAYRIEPLSAADQTVRVSLEAAGIAGEQSVRLVALGVDVFDLVAADPQGNRLAHTAGNGLIDIASEGRPDIHIEYSVRLGDSGKHGRAGVLDDRLLAFAGEQAILLPLQAYAADDREVERSLGQVTIAYEVPQDWTAVVPFPAEDGSATRLDGPTFHDLLMLRKSAIAFGRLDKLSIAKGEGFLDVYYPTSPGLPPNGKPDEETMGGLSRLYDFYALLFGFDLPRMSIVMLQPSSQGGDYVFAGAGAQMIGTTFDTHSKRDWELMGHRFFHAFFDWKVTSKLYQAPPSQWLYEGLATYYETASMSALPESLKLRLGTNVGESFSSLYRKYVYMTLKDASLLGFAPMEEDRIADSYGLLEFLHYTKAPLVVRAIEERSFELYGERNRMLQAILEHPTGEELQLSAIVHYALGDETDKFAARYLFGKELLPLWEHTDGGAENPEAVISELNGTEAILASWLREERADYPIDRLGAESLDRLAELAARRQVRFAPEETERKVEAMSPTVYKLLKQYVLRAEVAGVKTDDPELRFKLMNDKTAAEKWEKFLLSVRNDPVGGL